LKNIHRIVIDEGASTFIMSITCWKAIKSPSLIQSPNNLEAFDGRYSHPFGILPRLPITLEGKTVNVKVKFVDANDLQPFVGAKLDVRYACHGFIVI